MSVTQNEKIRQVTDTTMVIGVDITARPIGQEPSTGAALNWVRQSNSRTAQRVLTSFCAGHQSWRPNRRKTALCWGLNPQDTTVHPGGVPARGHHQAGAGQSIPCKAQQRTGRRTSQQERQERPKDHRKVGIGRALCTPVYPARAVCGAAGRHELPLSLKTAPVNTNA